VAAAAADSNSTTTFAGFLDPCLTAHSDQPTRHPAPSRPRQVVSPEAMVGYAESAKGSVASKIFEDAYKSPLSIVILVRDVTLHRYVEAPAVQHRWWDGAHT
jgi:hypothetical protein